MTNKPTGNPCPIKGCAARAKPGQLMCWPHWRRVPKALNRAVFDTHRAMIGTRGAERFGLIEAYRQARAAAIDAVNRKEAEA